ncbi:ATP-binding protein [Roseburia hominis]|uniref:ATP-binding protein n=1 Tax=Roseburia hominis TaxID=301301 RepID=UPI0026F29CE9|nr:AAA family ATPase [Roseburia hominis]MCI7521883.1 AAA family ATPase [Roseburia hominis]
MQIDRAAIFRFGKLADRTVDFAPGINIVYGKNEAGKTTLHAFLTAMLFGLEKGRGRAKGTEGYLRYEPWHAPSYYSGALQFSVGGRPFYLERNFYHKEPRARLCNLADGEELSVAYGDLGMLLGGVTREAYENTCDIPQCRAVTGAELTGLLAEYLSDMSDGGNAGIRVTRAVEKLEQKKRSLQSQIKSEQEKREQQLQQLTVERRMLEEDCGRLRGQIEEAAADMRVYAGMHPQVRTGQRLEDDRTAENAGKVESAESAGNAWSAGNARNSENAGTASDRERRTAGNGFPVKSFLIGLAAAVGLAGNAWWYQRAGYAPELFAAAEGILAILLGIGVAGILRHRSAVQARAGENAKEPAEAPESVAAEDAVRIRLAEAEKQSRRLLAGLEETLAEKETRRCNLAEQLEACSGAGTRERELQLELDAVDMAKNEIIRLSREYGDERRDEINSAVSRYVSAITEGKYDLAEVDETGKLRVQTEGREVLPEALSRGTLEQFYFAFRMAVGSIVTQEEPLPLLLDETFAMYDDDRLRQTLRLLAANGTQTILFTCQRREQKLLEELGIAYHMIEL